MDIVNFPGIIAEHGLLSSAQVDLAKDLILIGKKMGSQRDGTQYENMAISVLDLVALASGGAQTLAQTLALGNITGGLNVVFSGGSQAVFNSGAFSGGLTTLALTGNQTWSLPNQSGTIALLSDIPGPDLTLYNGDGTIGTNRIATLTDNLQFASTSGGINILHGIGADPLGFGEGGILSYVTMTPAANVEAYGGVRIISGEPTWCHQVYDAINNNEAGTYVGWSTAQSNPYSAIYYYNATTDDYFGFEANAFGEQLYSQRTALVTTTLTAADRVLFVSNAGGYLKATTYADLAAQLPINTFYTGNGSTVGARTVTLGGNLVFTGNTTITRGAGTTDATASQIWQASSTSEIARMTNGGGLAIGINGLAGGFANAARLRVDATITTDYTNAVVFDQTYNNAVNNTNSAATFATRIYKASAFNTGELISSYTIARNDGTGTINNLYGFSASTQLYGNATIGNAFAINAISSVRAGNITLYGGVDISWNEVGGGTIANMIGMFVRTPVNVSGGTVTNTYGVYLQANTIGTNNYGIVSNAQSSNGFGTDTPSVNAIVEVVSTTKALKLRPMTAAQASALTAEDGMLVNVSDTNGTFATVGVYSRDGGAWVKL